jgi:lysophospholipase L1-like esterase
MDAMKLNIGRAAWRVALAAGVTALVTLAGCTVWRLGEARALARASTAFQQEPPAPMLRLLVVGDSTGVGTGATRPSASVAGLLGMAYPRLLVHNHARDGARFDAVPDQLAAAIGYQGYDVVLIQAGGNDVIRGTDIAALAQVLDLSFSLAKARLLPGGVAIVQPAGNVGNAAFFLPPLSQLMRQRALELHTAVRRAAARHGVVFVNLYQEAAQDPFVQRPQLHAADGLHPSDAGYRVWRDELLAQTDLAKRLAPAR